MMEFSFDIDYILPGKITVIETDENLPGLKIFNKESEENDPTRSFGKWNYYMRANVPWDIRLQKMMQGLGVIIDEIGVASAKAQNLHTPITTFKKLLNSNQQKLYTLRDEENPRCLIGMLKVGIKRLFISDENGAYHELDPLCVLDFYIHESKQRQGYGHMLFNYMLEVEKVSPEALAIDRPSSKFLSFLQKHYDLKNPIAQNNNYVIFPNFFHHKKSNGVCQAVSRSEKSPNKIKAEMEALSSVHVPINSNELKKNKTFYSTAGNCLQWDDTFNNSPSVKNFEQKTSPKERLTPKVGSFSTPGTHRNGNDSWRIHEAMHGYQFIDNENSPHQATNR